MRVGLALPQYDYSVAGESPLRFDTVVEYARVAERAGVDSLWLSDHLVLDLAKYGGEATPAGVLDPVVVLGALTQLTRRPRLGTLVLCEALRPASVLAKTLATLDVLSGGRLTVGLGAGWYPPDYEAIGMVMPAPGERLARLREAVLVVTGLTGGGPCTFAGHWHAARDARNEPPSEQQPHPPVVLGGKGDRLLALVAELGVGWNTCWTWETGEYASRAAVLDRACEARGRDPAGVDRTLGLYALCGEDRRDLDRRFTRLRDVSPPGVVRAATVDEYRTGRLVGTPDEVRAQAAAWGALGVSEIILGVGAVPFAVTAPDDVELLVAAVRGTA